MVATMIDTTGALTGVTQSYITTFHDYLKQFLIWGQALFFSLLVINLAWLWFWYAVDKDNILQGLSAFFKKFFVITLFYTIMMHHEWLFSLILNSQSMGHTLTNKAIDPSSIISTGISISNNVLAAFSKASLLTELTGILLGIIFYVVICFCFLSIALDLALTLIMATALVSISTFFLGFAALGATSQIARQSLDALLGVCMKLLGIYLVVGAGSKTILDIAHNTQWAVISFDAYVWIIASVVLFWLLSKNLPNQMAKIVSGAVQDNQGTSTAAMAMTAIQVAKTASAAFKTASSAIAKGVTAARSTTPSAVDVSSQGGAGADGLAAKTGEGATNTAKDSGSASFGKISDHFKHLASKSAGGSGARESANVPGGSSARESANVSDGSQRPHESAQQPSAGHPSTSRRPAAGHPSSAGKSAAAPSSMRRQKPPASE